MQKIISLFQRNYDGDRLVRNEIVPGAEWVIAGEGIATRKYDGTCCLVAGGKLYKRHEIKRGGKVPENFQPANEIDENTGKQQGWVPVGDGPEDKYHREAFALGYDYIGHRLMDGTYELLGPKIQGNVELFERHILYRHEFIHEEPSAPRDFDGLREWFKQRDFEGIVWHHPDGRMVKIKGRDFGIKRRSAR